MKLTRRLGLVAAAVAIGLGFATPAQADTSLFECANPDPVKNMSLCVTATGGVDAASSQGHVAFNTNFYTSAEGCSMETWMTLSAGWDVWDSKRSTGSCDGGFQLGHHYGNGKLQTVKASTGTVANYVQAHVCVYLWWALGKPDHQTFCYDGTESVKIK
jgi:hypothetical protein